MENKHKKSSWNIKKISLVVSLVVAILSGIFYFTGIYDWLFSPEHTHTITQIQNGTNNVQNLVLGSENTKQSNIKTALFFWFLTTLLICYFFYIILKLFFDFEMEMTKIKKRKSR